jgi:collagenase-like PrtC family protease
MKYFSVPADFKKETIDDYDKLNKTYKDSRIIETYGNLTIRNLYGSGRSLSQLPKVDMAGLKDFVRYSRQKNIEFDYTLNTSHMNNREFKEEGIYELKRFLHDLYEAGVRYLTLTLPSLFGLVKSTGLDFKLKASAICSIDNANKAIAFKNMGADRMVVKELINRDFSILKRIRKVFGEQVEIIVNSPCHIDCCYRMSHYNQQSDDSIVSTNETSFNYYEHKCMMRRYSELGNWLKIIWVRPEDLKYYTQVGINYFKLQGRQSLIKGGDPVRVAECYFKEDYDGNLVYLINCFAPLNNFEVFLDNKKLAGFLEPFVEKENFCIRDCTQCDYCDVFAEKCLDVKNAEEVCELAENFYNEYDEYARMLKSVKVEKAAPLEKTIKEEGDFEF